jgi:Protein of unknown function (DUF3606)
MTRPIPYTSVIVDPMNCPQVEHWAKDLQVQPYDLRAAISVVGPRLSDLRRYFGRSAHIIFLDNRRNKSQTMGSPFHLPA